MFRPLLEQPVSAICWQWFISRKCGLTFTIFRFVRITYVCLKAWKHATPACVLPQKGNYESITIYSCDITIAIVLSFSVTTGTQTLHSRTMGLCQHAGGFQSTYTDESSGLLLNTKPLVLWDFLGGSILFIFVLITSPHHFGWCERNAFNVCRKKGLSQDHGERSNFQVFSSDWLILTLCHTCTQTHT